jgi:hypothetical protein
MGCLHYSWGLPPAACFFFPLGRAVGSSASALLAMIGALYDIDDRAKGRTADERLTLRQREARPVLARIRQFDFGSKDVEQMVVSWPVDFLPS